MSSSFTYIDTGVNNGASVIASLKRLGVEISCAQSPYAIEQSSGVILPGVGTFEAGMRSLEAQEFVVPLRERVESGKPTLFICLGLQLLFSQSEESPGVNGLGIIPGSVRRLAPPATVPHFGWNEVRGAPCGNGDAYFAHSYSVQDSPAGWERGVTDCGIRFTSFLKRNAVVATQFHPEVSGVFGARIIQEWLEDAIC